MNDAKVRDLEEPDGAAFAEFFFPRMCMFAGISDHHDVANLVGAGLAQYKTFRRPGNRPSHRLTAVVIVMRVGDQNSVGLDIGWKIITQPNPARVGIDQNLFTSRR